MVDDSGDGLDALAVPTIAELLAQYRDRTGASYDDMSRSVNGEITSAWMHKLTTAPPKSFPRDAGTIRRLADLLQVPITTILNAFAVSLGLPIEQRGSSLSVSLPPGTDVLEARDVEAIRSIVRQLVAARQAATPRPPSGPATEPIPRPDMSKVENIRLAEEPTTLRSVDAPKD